MSIISRFGYSLACSVLFFMLVGCQSMVTERTNHQLINSPQVVLAGSYHKHIDRICNIKTELENNGIKVLEPLCGKTINKGGDFIVLENDQPKALNDSTYRSIQKRFMANCKQADIIYVYNKDGYIGLSTAFEVGYAKGLGKRIICHEPPKDKGLQVSDFCEVIPYNDFLKLYPNR